MKTRILNNDLFGGAYTSEFLEKNKNNTINGSLVSDWNLSDVQCSVELLLPIFTDGEWVESATIEEIELVNNTKFKRERNSLLKDGVVVELNSFHFWFNESTLSSFIGLIGVSEKASSLSVQWKTKDKEWKTISIADAYQVSFLASKKIQTIYVN
jgi:hypothetical protein